jgi:hypothetical protein
VWGGGERGLKKEELVLVLASSSTSTTSTSGTTGSDRK